MSQVCPNCRYARQTTDRAPDWQCPACQMAYAKAGGSADQSYGRSIPMRSSPHPAKHGWGKWLTLLALLLAAFWFLKPFSPAAYKTRPDLSAGQPEVLLYATDWCGYCAAARNFFQARGIRYTEFNIEKNSAAQEGYRKLGGNGVPLIVVGETVVHGFNEQELGRHLSLWLK